MEVTNVTDLRQLSSSLSHHPHALVLTCAHTQAVSKVVKAKSPNTLIIVDGVCSVGGETLKMDAWVSVWWPLCVCIS